MQYPGYLAGWSYMTESSDMTHQPLVSVVIIFFNAEKFLREAIESVLAQSYKSWELLLVDDGSTDGSSRIASHYSERHHNRIRRLQHPRGENRGMCASRNLGIQCAAGKYLAFLDADDVWLPNKLQEQVAILEAHPEAGMLYGRTLYWRSWNSDSSRRSRDFVPALGVPSGKVQPPPGLLPKFLRGSASVPCTCSILVRTSVACQVGGFEESFAGRRTLYEDQAFYSKVCLETPILAFDRCWDRYRQHRDSSVAIASRTLLETTARRHFLEWLQEYLIAKRVKDAAVWQALRREMWRIKPWGGMSMSPGGLGWLKWAKKWLLKIEENLLPAAIGQRLWFRTGFPDGAQTFKAARLESNVTQSEARIKAPASLTITTAALPKGRPASVNRAPSVAIILLTLNQRETTLQCLASLKGAGALNHRVLLWDNGSSDDTCEAVRREFPEVAVHVHPSNLGVASGRNAAAWLAIELFQPSHLLFLDNDMIVEEGFVDALLAPFAENLKIAQTQAKLRLMDDRERLNDGGGAQISFFRFQAAQVGYGEIDRGQYDRVRDCIAFGGSTMVRTDVFQQLGGFDPQFDPFGPEDIDFSLRLRKAGYQALFVPDAVAYHKISHTFGKGYTGQYARLKAQHWLRLMRRHASLRQQLAFALIGMPCLAVTVICRESAHGNFAALLGILRGILDFVFPSLRAGEKS